MKGNKNVNSESELAENFTKFFSFLIKNKIATKDDTIESIFAKMMATDDSNNKEKVKPVKKEKINIANIIKDIYTKDENLFILELEKNYAFLIKRKEETVTRVLCPGTMSPVEQQKDVIIYDFFVLWWESDKKQKTIKKLEPLAEYGIPVHFVEIVPLTRIAILLVLVFVVEALTPPFPVPSQQRLLFPADIAFV
jgi:hypothetical protein